MFTKTPQGFTLTFVTGMSVEVSFDGRDQQRHVRVDTRSPGGPLVYAGHFSADNFAAMIHRLSEQDSGYTAEELAAMRNPMPRNPAYDGPDGIFADYQG